MPPPMPSRPSNRCAGGRRGRMKVIPSRHMLHLSGSGCITANFELARAHYETHTQQAMHRPSKSRRKFELRQLRAYTWRIC